MNMDLGAISARAGAPNDGLKKGPDDNTRVPASASEVALWSKQNSDATGMRYQWGRKDPFTFATNSEYNGWTTVDPYGKYPVKLYNGSSVLIHQEDRGDDNSGKLPSGGILLSSAVASSMSVVVANPITFFIGSNKEYIDKTGQSGDLYNYYWTSYSRGTDGQIGNANWHNLYLDSYIPLRHKSIYDPCPYGYRIPSNGTYNQFNSNPGWIRYSYIGGVIWSQFWMGTSVTRSHGDGLFQWVGLQFGTYYSTAASSFHGYMLWWLQNRAIIHNNKNWGSVAYGVSVRCIEECELLPDATEASAGY